MPAALLVRELGRQAYTPVWRAMQRFTEQRDEHRADELWLLEHEPVFTQGRNGKPEHLRQTGNIALVRSDRGGQVTYHAPGQIVAYLLIDLRRKGLGVKQLVEGLEQVVINCLAQIGIEAGRHTKAPGVYVDGRKIAALGLRVRHGCAYHGLALNVNMDLTPFGHINPCGYPELEVTQVRDLLPGVEQNTLQCCIRDQICQVFDYPSWESSDSDILSD